MKQLTTSTPQLKGIHVGIARPTRRMRVAIPQKKIASYRLYEVIF
jgi:hypothetical protein